MIGWPKLVETQDINLAYGEAVMKPLASTYMLVLVDRSGRTVYSARKCRGVHSTDRWKQDASWIKLEEVKLGGGDFSLDKSTNHNHLHCT